jgi:hypothetical protein
LRIGFWSWWQEMNYAGRKIDQPNIFKAVAKFKDFQNGMFLGVEELDSAQMLVYRAHRPGYEVKIWIGADGLPHHVEDEVSGWKVIETYYDYNSNIFIEAPR